MRILTTYSIKIKHYNHIFNDTVKIYRNAVNFFIQVCLKEWDAISDIERPLERQQFVERICHITKNRPSVKYNFDKDFYKFPSYLTTRRLQHYSGLIVKISVKKED